MLATVPAEGQYYILGQDRGTLKWNELKTSNYNFIYPAGSDSLAKVYAYQFELNRRNTMDGIRSDPDPISIILHNEYSRSNGTVVWAPKRVELFTMPPYEGSYPQPWEEQLAIHEGRHIGQMDHYTKGLYGFLSLFLGQSSVGLGIGWSPSSWIFEADAVICETMLSNAGRGRSGTFLQYYRASSIEGERRLYDHWRYGSYQRYTPSRYPFGYITSSYMTTASENYYATGDLLNAFVKYAILPNYWSKSFRKAVGMTDRESFTRSMQSMGQMWKEEDEARAPFTPFRYLSKRKEPNYTVYSQILSTPKGLLAIKSGYEHPTMLVQIMPDGSERELRPFPSYCSKVAVTQSRLYWSESNVDPRWTLKDKSVIKSYDFADGRMRKLTAKGHLFNPALSADENYLSVTGYRPEGGSDLILMTADGVVTDTIPAPLQGQITETAWIGDKVYALITVENGEGIWYINQKDGKAVSGWEEEVAPQYQTMTHLTSGDDALIFEFDLDGMSNIYTYTPVDKKLRKIVNSRLGAFSPQYDSTIRTLFYTVFDTKGYHPVSTPVVDLDNKVCDFTKPYKHIVAEKMAQEASKHIIIPSEAEKQALMDSIQALKPERYRKGSPGHLFNVHSWAPVYYNMDRFTEFSFPQWYRAVAPGAVILSQNQLGTATSLLGYSYHDRHHAGHFNFTYTGLYPAFEFSFDYNERDKTVFTYNKDYIGTEEGEAPLFITDTIAGHPSIEAGLKVYIPLKFNSGGINRTFVPYIDYSISNDTYFFNPDRPEMDGLLRQSLEYGIQFSFLLPQPKSLLYPSWGLSARIATIESVGDEEHNGTIGYGTVCLYTPGFFRTHGFKTTGTLQFQNNKLDYGYITNLAGMPRGYSSKTVSTQFAKATVDYAMPIYLNDTYVMSQYLMRLEIIPFADVAVNTDRNIKKKLLWSVGSDILFNGHIFHIGWELTFGVRCAFTKEFFNKKVKTPSFSFLFGTPMF